MDYGVVHMEANGKGFDMAFNAVRVVRVSVFDYHSGE